MVGTVTPVEEVVDDQAKRLNPRRDEHGDDSEGPDAKDKDKEKRERSRRQSALFEFANVEAIKEKVRIQKNPENQYNVHNMYHTTGFFQKVARHPYFENTTLGVIVINAIWIGVDTNYNKATDDSPKPGDYFNCNPWCGSYFMVADTLFFIYFTVEVFIRFMAFKRKKNCLCDGWFVFDSILVFLYAFDPFAIAIISKAAGGGSIDLPTSVLRLFRLARLSRLVRMLRSIPELMILVKGMVMALRPAFSAGVLLLMITYVFAIAMVNLFEREHEFRIEKIPANEVGFFYSVPDAMHSLIVYAMFLDDLSAFVYPVKDEHVIYLLPVFMYIALSNMVVFNMLIGVMCAVISGVAAEEREAMIVDKVHEKFGSVVKKLDSNNDMLISWDEFEKIVEIPEALQALESVKVDPEVLIEIAEDYFVDDGQPVCLTLEEFMNMVLDMRGGQGSNVSDVMLVSKRFSKKFLGVQNRIEKIERKCDDILSQLGVPHEKARAVSP